MNYSRQINRFTRFLYYSCRTKNEQITIRSEDIQILTQSLDPKLNATHIITSIDFGIEFIAVLELPSDDNITSQIDGIVYKIRRALLNKNDEILVFTDQEKFALEKNVNVSIYSNIPSFIIVNKFSEMLYEINRIKTKDFKHSYPVTYYLRPIKWLYAQYVSSNEILKLLHSELNQNIEKYLLQSRTQIKYLDAALKQHTTKLLYENSQDRIYNARQQCLNLNDEYIKETKRVSQLVIDLRSGQHDAQTIYQKLCGNEQITLQYMIDQLTKDVYQLEEEAKLDQHSRYQQSNYRQSLERHFDVHHTLTTNQSIIRRDVQSDNLTCTNATLNNDQISQSNDYHPAKIGRNRNEPPVSATNNNYPSTQLQNNPPVSATNNTYPSTQLQSKPDVPSVSATNNSYSSTEPLYTMMQPLSHIVYNNDERTPSRTVIPQNSRLSKPSSTDQIINVLLLGDTGVGKSTFINAFVNYLSFSTLEQAQSNKPVVLIPGSFMMTVGDDFKEHIVNFDDCDSSNNEDFNHLGQSVTQHCKSYVFDLHDGKKLCIIDTPGFGDTRGIDHDDRNMKHILEYINNLTHLNAICFLLKPNSSHLNIFFQSCFTQLFDFLGPDARKNLTFCFTNARSTFYSPGDTAPLLKFMLKSLSFPEIPFKKENTFCFDSQSFRYLVALQNQISFRNEDKRKFEMSWTKSYIQSNHLIDYVRTKLDVHYIQKGWKSNKHAQFEIVYMIRPILEAMGNILRNIILWDLESQEKLIILCPVVIHRPAYLCLSCNPNIIQIGKFSITEDFPHEWHNTCFVCSCPTNQHIQIDYLLEYKLVNSTSTHEKDEMNDQLSMLLKAIAAFAYFLMHVAGCTKENQFLVGLARMIKQENVTCEKLKANHLNLQLVKGLEKQKQKHEKRINKMISNQHDNDLTVIYQWIDKIKQIPMVKEQLAVIKKGQEIIMKQHQINPLQV